MPPRPRGRGFFNRHFAALRGLQGPFPRAPEHWRQVLSEALYSFAGDKAERKARDLAELLRDGATGRQRAGRHRAPVFRPASQEQRESLTADILASRQPPAVLAERLFRILDQNHRYAESTGESHFFVRTLHNLGTRLLEQEALPADALARLGTLIERALVWEPMNPYCWMLWADWLDRQGRCDGREWVLREMLRLFPTNEPARVELARLLIRHGEAHWDEAERRLREVADRNPNHGHSRVVLAGLLVRRHKTPEAVLLLQDLLAINPINPIARQFLDHLEGGVDEAWDEGEALDAIELTTAADGGSTSSIAIGSQSLTENALAEVARRGRLSTEFTRALIATGQAAAPTEALDEATRCGDALAGHYHQWLKPGTTPAPPPHAWAWRACRLWQDEGSAHDWQQLEQDCPELRMQTRFLYLLTPLDAAEFEQENRRWRQRYAEAEGDESTAAVRFMRGQLDRLSDSAPERRNDTALAVLAGAAVGAPEFAA